MNNGTILVIGGVAVTGIVVWYLYQKQLARQAAINANPINQLEQALGANAGSLLTTGSTVAGGIISSLGNSLGNLFGNNNSSGIYSPTDLNWGSSGSS